MADLVPVCPRCHGPSAADGEGALRRGASLVCGACGARFEPPAWGAWVRPDAPEKGHVTLLTSPELFFHP